MNIKLFFKTHREIIMYLIFGVATTIVSWGTYDIFVALLNMTVKTGNILSWVCAVLFAFVTNKFFVFKSSDLDLKTLIPEFSTFISSRLLTGVIEILGVPLLVRIGLSQALLGAEGMLAKIVVSVVVVILNYVFSKLVVFKKEKN